MVVRLDTERMLSNEPRRRKVSGEEAEGDDGGVLRPADVGVEGGLSAPK
jgi:hypothetical protein